MYLLLGYGISNQSVSNILKKKKIDYKIFDGFKDEIEESILENIEIIVRSPGISLCHPLLMIAKARQIEIISEIEFAYLCNNKGKIVALTGSNGKTSTLYYAYQILKTHFKDVLLIGNNGYPYSSYIDKITDSTIILLELSNFQLENTLSLKPFISVITNISINHLDKVSNYNEYIKSKLKILKNAENIILNYDDEILKNMCNNLSENVSLIDNVDWYFDNYKLYYKGEIVIDNFNNKSLKGEHNIRNLIMAVAISYKLGVPFNKIEKCLNRIKGVEYRLQFLKEKDGILIYNDGKSSTPYSTLAAINSFKGKVIHLILGGRDKNMDFNVLKNIENVKFYAYGEVKDYLNKLLNATIFNTFKEAYNSIDAKKGEIILFSPGCASFDQFKNYEERAKAFEQLVLND